MKRFLVWAENDLEGKLQLYYLTKDPFQETRGRVSSFPEVRGLVKRLKKEIEGETGEMIGVSFRPPFDVTITINGPHTYYRPLNMMEIHEFLAVSSEL